MEKAPSDVDKTIDEFYIQALMLSKVVMRLLKKKAHITLTRKPALIIKPVTEFMQRLRVSGITKFEGKTYLSTINFYEKEEDIENHQAMGALIVYIGEEYIVELLKKMDYPDVDEDEEEALEDACGTFCNLIAGNFKSGLTQLGYIELVMSHFSGFQNEVLNGVEFHPAQKQMYEIDYEIEGEKRIVTELCMGPVPLLDF